ncbi:hypothetical protein MSG28_012947 [Choristoneura fumiferana]|uniref:Uncharacterized protein n=2 Tax=Choristoneura fumiferana TaxID=7141 RepID=A0ACC0KRF6_CHOFU|nr:hypothetical protein MSG28_012947 [Choristoneura fumiferana]
MKVLIALALVGLVAGKAVESPVEIDYHNKVGIPAAARIKAAEEAINFDGSRIVGGSAAALGQFPYQGGLVITMSTGGTSVCGSTMLTNTRGLTAAHCWRTLFSQARSFTVVYGSALLFSGGTRVDTTNVELHGSYNMITLVNDIAVITHANVAYTNNIRNIALASGTNQFVGTWATASGYGLTSDGGSITTNQFLSHVNLQVITNAVCAATYGTSTVVDSTICVATTGGRSTCGGDSGGPLVANQQLIGVVSFGHRDGCQRNHPAGFARVTTFTSWIEARL